MNPSLENKCASADLRLAVATHSFATAGEILNEFSRLKATYDVLIGTIQQEHIQM